MGTNKKPLRRASAIKKNNSPRGGQLCFMIDNLKFKLGITPASKFNFEFNEDLKIYEVFECLERDKIGCIGVRADA